MPRPIGLQSKLKNNSNKNFRENEEWQKGKKIGRRKQIWVWDDNDELANIVPTVGHWERVV